MPRDLIAYPETKVVDADGLVLLRAAERIEERGWWGGPRCEVSGSGPIPRCALLAISDVLGSMSEADCSRFAARLGVESIPRWNDAQPNAEAVTSHLRAAALQS